MKPFLPIAFLFVCSRLFAQQTVPADNLLLGYQEFPTTISGHTADNAGNQYYTGIFRGQLTVNNQVLTGGNGLEDIFWVKTNGTGQLLRYAVFGSANSEGSYTNAMAMGGNNRMVFGLSTNETLTLGGTTLTPYTSSSAGSSGFAAGLVCVDTAGTVLWSRKTTLQNFKIYYANNIYHVFGQVLPFSSATKYGDVTVLDSLGKAGIVHLMIDENGNFLGAKSITVPKANQGVSLYNVDFFSDKTLFLQVRVDGDSSFRVQNTTLPLPGVLGIYQFFLRTDTSYTALKLKLLNPLRHALAGLGNQWLPACVGPADSVYTVFAYENNAVPFSLDGFPQQALRNTLYVMDPSLTVRRQVFLGNSSAGTYPLNQFRRRIMFRQLLFQNGRLFLTGVFTGVNESPITAIAAKDTTVAVLPGVSATVNQNGPSKSFIAKCDVNGTAGALNWYGDHTEYETINVSPSFLHSAGPGRLCFVQLADNVWNPWTVDENLTVVTGAMRKGVDFPEIPQMVQYFADGSRVVLGYARGKTALDANNTFFTNTARRDVFIVRLRANNGVAWYKRFFSTLSSSDIRGLEIRNGKAYFLANYLGSQNDSNYIQAGSDLYNVRTNASLLASVDTAGNLTVLNLANPLLRPSMLLHFSFFSNDDLAVVTDVNPVLYAGFPSSFSQQIFRLKPTTGAILEGRKFLGTSTISINTVRIDKNDGLYVSGATASAVSYKMYLHNGTAVIDSLQVAGGTQTYPSLLKMDWNRFQWLKRFSGSGLVRQLGDLALVADKPMMSITSSATNQPLLWEGQTVHNGYSVPTFSLVKLNTDGSLAQAKTLVNVTQSFMRAGDKARLYVSGLFRGAQQIDTIQLGYAGGSSDGIALVLDSNLVAKRSFRVGSPYSESMFDMDIYADSLVALAYTGQTTPQVYLSRTLAATSDYLEDAYLGTLALKTGVVTGINTPMPALHSVAVAPNPVAGRVVQLSASVPEPLRSTCTVYQSNGQYVTSTVVQFVPGVSRYTVFLPKTTGGGTYLIVISNKRWTTTKTFLVL